MDCELKFCAGCGNVSFNLVGESYVVCEECGRQGPRAFVLGESEDEQTNPIKEEEEEEEKPMGLKIVIDDDVIWDVEESARVVYDQTDSHDPDDASSMIHCKFTSEGLVVERVLRGEVIDTLSCMGHDLHELFFPKRRK